MSGKSCRRCGRRVTFGEYVRTTSLRFDCRQCGVELSVDLRRAFLAPLISAVPLALTMSQALTQPVWWLGVACALAFSFLLHHGLLRVELHRGSNAASSRG